MGRAQTKPGIARYRTKAFLHEADAWDWAERTVAKYRLGLDNGNRCSISAVLDDYIEHLRGKGASPNHVVQVRLVLERVVNAGINDLRDEKLPAKVEAYFRNLKIQSTDESGKVRRKNITDASPRTKNCYLSMVIALCSWATRMRMLPFHPLRGVVSFIRQPLKTKPVFTIDEMKTLLNDNLRSQMFWLPFALSIYSGLRIAEAFHVSWQDVKWTERRLHIRLKPEYRLKGQKERYAPLPDELIDILRPIAKPHGWIIENKYRDNPKMWRWFFMRLLRAAKIEPIGRSPHSTRHTWAALSIATGLDSFLVMEAAGHANLSTTLRYARCASFFRDAVKGWEKGEFRLRSFQTSIAKLPS